MQHGGSDRIGAERQAADGVIIQACRGVQHDPAGQRSGSAVEQDPAQVYVPVGVLPGRQDHLAMDDSEALDHGEQVVSIGHSSRAYRGWPG